MNICKLSTCDNLEEIFTRSTILHISYVLNILVRKVCKFQGESLSSLWLITCWKYHIALFSLYEFFPLGFSYKVFNEVISTQDYVISSIFPEEVFWWMILEHMIHCTLFFMWVFPVEVSHIKFLMRQWQHKVICYVI